MYNNLKYVIPGTTIGTTLDQLDLKLKEAQSDPLIRELMCEYKYENILDVTKVLVAKGVFEIDQGFTLSYLAACRAARKARDIAEKGDDIAQASGSGKDDTSTFRTLRSTVSEANVPTTSEANKSTASSDTAAKQFDSLLQEHLEASKSPSITSVVPPSLEPAKAAEHDSLEQMNDEDELDTETVEAAGELKKRKNVPLRDEQGLYYEEHLERIYQILKPDLRGNDYNTTGRSAMLRRDFTQMLETNSEFQEACQRHGLTAVRYLMGSLVLRGLFFVDYVKFPSYREAAEEAFKLVPRYPKLVTSTRAVVSDDNGMPSSKAPTTAKQQPAASRESSDLESSDTTQSFEASVPETQRDHSTNASAAMDLETSLTTEALKELSQTSPWESIKFPNMYEIEPSISRDAIPEFWKMKFFPAQEKLEILHNINSVHDEIANSMDCTYIRLPSMQELESWSDHDSELNVNGLRLLDFEPPESSTPVLVQNSTESGSSADAEVVTDEQDRKPSKVLFVSGIGRGINVKHLFKEFADVCPVNVNFNASKRVAVIEFTDIEAATKALEAKHGVVLSGRALNCEFGNESSLNGQVGVRTIASEQPTDYQKDIESVITKEDDIINEQLGTPSKVLFVGCIHKSVNVIRLIKEFAEFSPVDIQYSVFKRVALIEFADIKAATEALKAKHGTLLCGKALNCAFNRDDDPLRKTVGVRTIAPDQPSDDHKDAKSTVPEEVMANESSTPSKVLIVGGIQESVNAVRLYNEFADVSPVDIRINYPKRFAFVEFSDIKAAEKALRAKRDDLLNGTALTFTFSNEIPQENRVGARKNAFEQPIDEHIDDLSSTSVPPKVEDTVSVPTATTMGTVARVPEEIMKESVGKAPTDITAETVRYAPTQSIADELMLFSEPDPLDQTTPSRKSSRRQRKVARAKAAQSMTKEREPTTETELDKSVFETSTESIKNQAETTTVEPPGATSDDRPLYDGGAYNESASSSSIDLETLHDLEKDDLVYENEPPSLDEPLSLDEPPSLDEPSSSDELKSKAYQELLREAGLKKGPIVDRIPPEIRQYATIRVPRTRAYYLPYSSQNRVLSGLQASLEQVCYRYLQRRHPKLLEETPVRWAIDSAHAFELNRYVYLIEGLIVPNANVDMGPGGSRSLPALVKSIAALRHHAVHRFRVDIGALRFWAVDAVRLAKLLDDPEAARQFSSLVSSLEAQHNRMKAEKMKAEEDLLVTVRELAAKRAELLRMEREAMTAYEAAHKELPTRTEELDRAIDANIPLDHGFSVEWKETSSVEGTSSAKPASGIFGRIKSWFGA
ncbi:hypothetical protein KCU65_g3416, partial [Aureobasidium melanogenum]